LSGWIVAIAGYIKVAINIFMPDAVLGWLLILTVCGVTAVVIINPKVGTYEQAIPTEKPIKLGNKTWANERELIADVCRTDPTIRGCR
jgi:hypothetical protein